MGASAIAEWIASADKERLNPLTGGWAMAALVLALVLALTGIGSLDLAKAHSSTTGKAGQSPSVDPDPQKVLPSDVRIESSRWMQLVAGGPKQMVVHYHAASSKHLLALVLAWDRSAHNWVPVYNGPSTTSDVLVPTGSSTEAQFAQELVDAVDSRSGGRYDIPASSANIALIEEWMAHEGGLWANNPLNTSLDAAEYPHEITSSGEDTGIPIYPSLQVGVENTAATLLGNPAYAPILSALENGGGSCMVFASAVVESPWAASHYGWDAGGFCPGGDAPQLLASPSAAPSQSTSQPAPGSKHGRKAREHGRAPRAQAPRGGRHEVVNGGVSTPFGRSAVPTDSHHSRVHGSHSSPSTGRQRHA